MMMMMMMTTTPLSRAAVGRSGRRGLLPLVLLLAATMLLLQVLPPAAHAASTPPKTVFKPYHVRFVPKSGTTELPANGAVASLSAAANDNNAPVRPAPQFPPRAVPDISSDFARFAPSPAGSAQSTVAKTSHGGSKGGHGGAAPRGKVELGFRALNAYESISAVYGGPLEGEIDPPNHSVAVSDAHVVESINAAMRVYNKKGQPQSPPVSLYSFFGVPVAAANGCARVKAATSLYDTSLRRWFQIVLNRGLDDECRWTGTSSLRIAVSETASPIGKYSLYSIDTSNDGFLDAPAVPGCETGCEPNYPRAQLGQNAIVITANTYAYDIGAPTGSQYIGASVYVLDKFALARGDEKFAVAEFQLTTPVDWDGGALPFTVSPAYYPPPLPKGGHGGGGKSGKSGHGGGGASTNDDPFLLLAHSTSDAQRLLRFALTGTRAVKGAVDQEKLDALMQALSLSASPVVMPEPVENQEARTTAQPSQGSFPLGQSLGIDKPGELDAPDGRMYSSSVAAGRHYGTFNVRATAAGGSSSSIAVLLVQLDASTGKFLRMDWLGETGEDAMYPAVAVANTGKGGVVAITASAADVYASVGFFAIGGGGKKGGEVGRRQFALPGRGLLDSYSQYPPSKEPRTGDYSSAVVDENGLFWGGTEYVSTMSCSLASYENDPTCGGTRAARNNFDTGIVAVKVK